MTARMAAATTKAHRFGLLALAVCALSTASVLTGCDDSISGAAFDNAAPETELSVRDENLVDNLDEADRLTSTVRISWSGTDADGYIAAYDIRFYDEGVSLGAEDGWTRTTATDTLVLLPIPRGQRTANVVFEARSLDNEGALDASPARTVFPIVNAPPTLRLSSFDLPPDTTFNVVSFGVVADDPEGETNLDRIEIGLNDSTNLVALPPDTEFFTLVGQAEVGSDDDETTARVFLGRGFGRGQSEIITLPGLKLDADNTIYLRAADVTDTTSALERYTWYVRQPASDILFVNDYRIGTAPTVIGYHLDLLRSYLPAGREVDTWDISRPYGTGSSGNTPRSTALPATADPTLAQTLAQYRYIYWVSTNSTDNVARNNLPYAASVMQPFFEAGGKLMVHTPISLPEQQEDNLGNPAILVLPLDGLITIPDTLRPSLRLTTGADLIPQSEVPGLGITLPALETDRTIINTLPYIAESSQSVPLYTAAYSAISASNPRVRPPWGGPSVIASITDDRRVGLFALPLVNDSDGTPQLIGQDGDTDAGRQAIFLMLESLGFPK